MITSIETFKRFPALNDRNNANLDAAGGQEGESFVSLENQRVGWALIFRPPPAASWTNACATFAVCRKSDPATRRIRSAPVPGSFNSRGLATSKENSHAKQPQNRWLKKVDARNPDQISEQPGDVKI